MVLARDGANKCPAGWFDKTPDPLFGGSRCFFDKSLKRPNFNGFKDCLLGHKRPLSSKAIGDRGEASQS
jgi:hypothetical protein